jgi:hypothetical protein
MSKRKNTKKVTPGFKMTMGALSVLGVVGGWNIISRYENAGSPEDIVVDESLDPTPTTILPSPTPWPTIQPLAEMPRLEIKRLPTLAAGDFTGAQTDVSLQEPQGAGDSLALSVMPSVAPMPTLAPLPTMPEYVPPPPPPPRPAQVASAPSSGGGSSGGNKSKGS